jgi:hypothetical protein
MTIQAPINIHCFAKPDPGRGLVYLDFTGSRALINTAAPVPSLFSNHIQAHALVYLIDIGISSPAKHDFSGIPLPLL